ncbi:unnamed protein product [Adineta steineri]|uniref:Uncharacterized protein n=1 Tax=Adineta steineri TaxID=433720 RepID=A0A815RME8_9BILA|nr:unnamed protein product [Adineta steineri]CAF1477785.1 unnamed protein product [Adineta steineri]CAF1637743.1 unnamed protein product [Adineta steineri]CAF3808801.1 unnamed protein product [Adineta steineri]
METSLSTRLTGDQWIVDSHLLIEWKDFSACEIYSPSNRKWRETAVMNVGRNGLTLTSLSNDRNILAICGSRNDLDAYTAEIYYIDMNI